jgi:hypothetical protein
MGNPQYTIEPFSGSRSDLPLLFREADDSASEITSYMELGEVLVARSMSKLLVTYS